MTPALAPTDRDTLLTIAREALTAVLAGGPTPSWAGASVALQEERASFVTLARRADGELRGCRGELVARRPLADSVARMAVAAGTDDPRFPPVEVEELTAIRVEINALSPLAPVAAEQIEVGRHGLVLRLGGHAGVLLPEVPLRLGWTRDQFLAGLCQKAGVPRTAWRGPGVELLAFETECWAEP